MASASFGSIRMEARARPVFGGRRGNSGARTQEPSAGDPPPDSSERLGNQRMANAREYRICARESTNREISGVFLLALSRPRLSACCCRRSSGRSCRLDCCCHRGKNRRRERKDSAGIPRHRCRTGWGDSSVLVATHTCGLRRSCHCCCRGKNDRHRCTTG